MKINKLWLALVSLVILVFALFFLIWKWPQGSLATEPIQSKAANIVRGSFISPLNVVSRQIPGGPYEPSDPRWAKRQRRIELDPVADWETSFIFYGKVLDQNNAPIGGARVHLVWNDVSESGSASVDISSDENGCFSLKGKKGKRLVVSITKPGYYSADSNPLNQMTFEFAIFSDVDYHEPDSTQPVLFKMREIGNTEPLIHFQRTYYSPKNSNEVDIGLKKWSQPDLKVIFTHGNKNPNAHFDWTVSIQGVDGTGLLEAQNPQQFVAPEEGYQNQVDLNMPASDPNWKVLVQKYYFVHLHNGNYALIEAELSLSYTYNASVILSVTLNPSNSPNLEFDPSKLINK